MNRSECTPKLVASHINSATALPRLQRQPGIAGPMLRVPALHTEVDERLPATCLGGLILPLALWRRFGVAKAIDGRVHVLERHKPYHESDHVLAQVLNLYSGGTCIEDQAHLQLDRAVHRMAGTPAIPDPTTSGDFLRRFDREKSRGGLDGLRAVVDGVQDQVWSAIPA